MKYSTRLRCYAFIHHLSIRLFGSDMAGRWLESCWCYDQLSDEIDRHIDNILEQYRLRLISRTQVL